MNHDYGINDKRQADSASHDSRESRSGASPDELWMVQAIIQPFKLDPVTRALEDVNGLAGMTVTKVRGFGREKLEDRAAGARAARPGKAPREALDDFTDKLRLDIAVCDAQRANEVATIVARAAYTGNRGDGKIFLWPLSRVVRVRTLEEGRDAL